MFLSCDLLFLFPVAIGKPVVNALCVYTQYRNVKVKKSVDLSTHHELRYLHTSFIGVVQIAKPGSGGTLTGPLTTNDRMSIEVAMLNHTQTRPKYQYRFLALHRSDRSAAPCRLSVEAFTEKEARQVLSAHFILSLAARLPVQEVRHA
ncbi:TPA: host cell division inhibitor Icd-like protein [Yersinia enterocolitica]